LKKKALSMAILLIVLILAMSFFVPVNAVKLVVKDKYKLFEHPQDAQWSYTVGNLPIPNHIPVLKPDGTRVNSPNQNLLNLFQKYDNQAFKNWNFKLSTKPAPGEFWIERFDIMKNLDGVYDGSFVVDYVETDPNFPPPGEVLEWIQFIVTDWPSWDSTITTQTVYVDPTPNNDNLPFVYPYLFPKPGGVSLRFADEPYRPLERDDILWRAYLYLVTWDGVTTVTFYDGLCYGFSIHRTGMGSGTDKNGGIGGVKDSFENITDPGPYIPGFDPVNVINLEAYPTSVVPDENVYISLVVQNQGDDIANFNVKVYADENTIVCGDEYTLGTQTLFDVPPGENRILDFIWDTEGVPYDYYWISAEASTGSGKIDYLIAPIWIGSAPVGGIVVPVDKLALLAPYIGLASTIVVATVATAIYTKRVKRRKEKQ
jgi:hypothetical protein